MTNPKVFAALALPVVVLGLVTIPASAIYVANQPQSNTAAALSTSSRFHDLLRQGDSADVARLLGRWT